jgi:hypothetical protein
MPDVRSSIKAHLRAEAARRWGLVLAFALAALLLTASTAAAAPTVPPGYSVTRFATPPPESTNCDDLTRLDGHLFITCQNGTQSTGGGGDSTIVEYARNGTVLNSWSLVDKADGIGADPAHHRVIVTLNEDGNSHLATITPGAPPGSQITNYAYSCLPDSTCTGALATGGGTDSVTVDRAGNIFVVASNNNGGADTVVFRVTLSGTTATLHPTFNADATANNGNTGTGTVTLNLTDPDSSAIVPFASPFYRGQLAVTDQTADQLVFSSDPAGGGGTLTALNITENGTPAALDDIRWATVDGGTLYVVDKGPGGASVLYRVRGPFKRGTALASVTTSVDTVNLGPGIMAGVATPLVSGLVAPKGLWYVPNPPSGNDQGQNTNPGGQGQNDNHQ